MSYELKTGKFGVYFFDNANESNLGLDEVLSLINTAGNYFKQADDKIASLETQVESLTQTKKQIIDEHMKKACGCGGDA